MATMNISLPDEMKAWVEAQVGDGRYANTSDFVRDLIRDYRAHQEYEAWLKVEIQKGLDSGVSKRTIDEIWADAKAKARAERS